MDYTLPNCIKIGGKLEYNSQQFEICIPKNEFKGMSYAYGFKNEFFFTEMLEFCVLNLIKEIGFENTKVYIIEFNLNSKHLKEHYVEEKMLHI